MSRNIFSLWAESTRVLKRSCRIGSAFNLVVKDQLVHRLRFVFSNLQRNMEEQTQTCHPSLMPPTGVKGMTELNKDLFKKSLKIPGFKIEKKQISNLRKSWKSLHLHLRGLRPVAELGDKDPLKATHSLILLDPAKLDPEALTPERMRKLENLAVDPSKLEMFEIELHYDNWSATDIFRAVLPEESDNVSSFTQVGHIAHLNLKPESIPFKSLIGEVILDKVPSVKTVVNKLNMIDNTYRNFQMELLAGEDNFITQTRENGHVFELDFSKVYWNSRLSTEHGRIVDAVPEGSIVYDVFAGVGPFAVPLGRRKKCTVFANDLNPHSFQALNKNLELNKVNKNKGLVHTSNMDGRKFIATVVKRELVKQIEKVCRLVTTEKHSGEISGDIVSTCTSDNLEKQLAAISDSSKLQSSYIVMNLPALAVDFLDAFPLLLSDLPVEFRKTELLRCLLPTIYCYTFTSKSPERDEEVKSRAARALGQTVPKDWTMRLVRNVAPNKEMMCISFKLWPELILGPVPADGTVLKGTPDENIYTDGDEPQSKKQKVGT